MKVLKFIICLVCICAMYMSHAQDAQNVTGKMDATTINTFKYKKDGVEYPYAVTVRENRAYKKPFNDSADEQSKIEHRQLTQVAKLITVSNEHDPVDNRVISLRYEKGINDTFKITTNEKGFTVKVGDRQIDYIMGEGVSFPSTDDENFFSIAEYDLIK